MIKVILYDFDGTIYDDAAQFDVYAHLVAGYLPPDRTAAFWREYERARAGEHPRIRPGRYYHTPTAWSLELDDAGRIAAAWRGEGDPVPRSEWNGLPERPQHDGQEMINIGDLWGVLLALSREFGLSREMNRACFMGTRAHMAGPQFQFRPIPGLRETMALLKGKVAQVVATNSPAEASVPVLEKLGLLELFDRTFYGANKPFGLPELVERLQAEFNARPEEILSVGDNYPNEIAPARALGLATAFIDPHRIGRPGAADVHVPSMTALLPYLRTLGGS